MSGWRETDCDLLVRTLRERGDLGMHTFEIRQQLNIGNPSQRLNELEGEGYTFDRDPEVFGPRSRRGKRIRLTGEPESCRVTAVTDDEPRLAPALASSPHPGQAPTSARCAINDDDWDEAA